MAYIPNQQINTGSFVPTTNVWDVAAISDIDVNSSEFKELLVRLYQNVNNIALVLNTKDSAFYLTQEFSTSQLYFNPISFSQLDLRPGFRILVNTGALAAGAKTVAHGLSPDVNWTFTFINGAASNTGTLIYYPLPFAGAAGNNIEISVNDTNVLINNASGVTFTDSYVILEYLKS
jgi:hypothetical protein